MRNPLRRAVNAFAAAALVVFAAYAVAPSSAGAQSSVQSAPSGPVDLDEATIQEFVTAAKGVVALRREYGPRLEAAPNQAAAQEIVQEARGLMTEAITDTGMTLERYLEIAEAVQNNPALRARIEEMVGVE